MSSDYLFARPSFVRGAARTLDLWGALDAYNWSSTPLAAESTAMAVDWACVGQELSEAINALSDQFRKEDERQLRLVFGAQS